MNLNQISIKPNSRISINGVLVSGLVIDKVSLVMLDQVKSIVF